MTTRRKGPIATYWPILPMLVVLACLLLLDLDSLGYSPLGEEPCSLQEKTHTGISESLYRPLTSFVFHSAPSPRVQVVTISSGSEPGSIMTNTCDARLFLSGLVNRLNAAHVEMIVIDKYYSRDSCQDQADNNIFVKAMNDSVVPVVVGRPTHNRSGEAADSCLVLSDKFDLGPKVHYGLTRLNNDTLKIPLEWYVLQDDKQTQSTTANGDGLAFVAAQLDDRDIKNRPGIQKLLATGQHPYGSFAPQRAAIPAMQIFCSATGDPADPAHTRWGSACASIAKPDIDLNGKIVVVGDQSDQDLQPFPGGDRYGVFLQADYLEAILANRFLKEVPLSIALSLLVAWLVCIYLTFWFVKPERALIICVLIYAGLVLLSLLALLLFAYFTPLWIIWGAGVLLGFRYLDSRGHLLSEHLAHHEPHEHNH